MLWVVLLVCASPLIASYFTYYVLKPEKRNNYGALIDQRAHPIPALATTTLDGKAVDNWLPADPGTSAADHIYMIDPLGHLMMRFPKDPEPRKVYKDIYKLL